MERSIYESAHFYSPDELNNLLLAKGFKILTISNLRLYKIEAMKEQ
ncbi:MAG TPA: hypothetical protein PK922_04320 [Syntrophorhabdus sp.]|nr:hypothetical protein [Syntrophorhabdus sp.]